MMVVRWRVTVIYRTDTGSVDVIHDLEELEEIEELIDAGPHWDTVIEIKIVRVNHIDSPTLTVEQAAGL